MALDQVTKLTLALWLVRGLGPKKISQLFTVFKNIEYIFEAPICQLIKVEGITAKIANEIKTVLSSTRLQQEQELIDKYQLKITSIHSSGYPQSLKEIYSAPPVLYHKGSIDFQKGLYIGIVGSRKASFAGKNFCKKLIQQLSVLNRNIVIVSGLALGIDTVAHQSALENGLKTVAVLAGGLSSIYPATNKNLATQITDNGTLLTEFPVTSKPTARHFPLRNRIISGISSGVIVIEAGEKSGAVITANYATEQNRELFAVPGPVESTFFIGTNRLIQKGHAKLILDAADVLEELDPAFTRQKPPKSSSQSNHINHLSDKEIMVVERLKAGESSQNHLSEELNIPINILLGVLTALELKGIITIKSGSSIQLLQF